MTISYLKEDYSLHKDHADSYSITALAGLLNTMRTALSSVYMKDKVEEVLTNSLLLIMGLPEPELLKLNFKDSANAGMLYSTVSLLSKEDLDDLGELLKVTEENYLASFVAFSDTQAVFYSPKEDGIITSALFMRKYFDIIKNSQELKTGFLTYIRNSEQLRVITPTVELLLGMVSAQP